MEDLNIKTIRFPEKANEKLSKIAIRFGRTKLKVFLQMLDYFYNSKKDPADLNDDALRNAILKGNTQLGGFIKAQEKILLIPMKQDTERIINAQLKILEWLGTDEVPHRHKIEEALLNHKVQLNETISLIKSWHSRLLTTDALKKKFEELFDSYAKQRDQFSIMTSNREREELFLSFRKKIQNL